MFQVDVYIEGLISLLKKHFGAIMIGILSGVLTSLVSIFAMSCLFQLSYSEYVTLLPKSITTALILSWI